MSDLIGPALGSIMAAIISGPWIALGADPIY
jgi:hypothetical protein